MTDPLEYLLGSKIKLRILKTLMFAGDEFLGEEIVVHRVQYPWKSVKAELNKLVDLGFVKTITNVNQFMYKLDQEYFLFKELKDLLAKSNLIPGSRVVKAIRELGDVTYAAFTGIFTGNKKSMVDLLIVGDRLDRRKIRKIIASVEADAGREINYTIFDTDELFYRLDMLDKFVLDIIEGSNVLVVDRIKEKKRYIRRLNY